MNDYYWIRIITWNHIIVYKLLVKCWCEKFKRSGGWGEAGKCNAGRQQKLENVTMKKL